MTRATLAQVQLNLYVATQKPTQILLNLSCVRLIDDAISFNRPVKVKAEVTQEPIPFNLSGNNVALQIENRYC